MSKELLLSEEENRYVIFPIKQEPIWKMYKKAMSSFWTPEEIDLSKDHPDIIKRIEKIMIQEHETAELDRFKIKELNDI